MAKVLVIGSGGREHALAHKLCQSALVNKCFVYPGNSIVQNLNHDCPKLEPAEGFPGMSSFIKIGEWCEENKISLVCVGPEDPLSKGIVDTLSNKGIPCFGPTKKASQIESSKSFSKRLMDDYKIPTAEWKEFSDPQAAIQFININNWGSWVLKADGLAAGKGVVICHDKNSAVQTVHDMMIDKKFGGDCSSKMVIEQYLTGYEVSMLCFTDGKTVKCMPPSQDHKKILDGDRGPNTGGMGAYCPCDLVSESTRAELEDIMCRTVEALHLTGNLFSGCLYGGFMVTQNGVKVLEFNCRFGDPETQVIMPLLQSDLYEIMLACSSGTLDKVAVQFDSDKYAVAVVLVSDGYPGKYEKNKVIIGADQLTNKSQIVYYAGTKLNSEGQLVTNGGRVLACTAVQSNLSDAVRLANQMAESISFEGKFYRKDIAHQALVVKGNSGGLSYAECGVDINAGEKLVSTIRPYCKATDRSGCMGSLGMFGSVFDLKMTNYRDPLIVSGTDGVGTKLEGESLLVSHEFIVVTEDILALDIFDQCLAMTEQCGVKIASQCNLHSTIGIDLVAMCVNDILCHGAEPLYFLDYFSTGKLDVHMAAQVIKGIAEGCKEAGCALVGGETAEMSGMYAAGKYDLAGFAVGAVERTNYIPQFKELGEGDSDRHLYVTEGDVVVGLSSSGIHSNGFSMVRKIIEKTGLKYNDICPFDQSQTLSASLLTPTRIYVKTVLPLIHSQLIKSISHITGGGLFENIPRVLPDHLSVRLNTKNWSMHPVFNWIQTNGNISAHEMFRTFNCGIGMVLIVSKDNAEQVCQRTGGTAIGHVCRSEPDCDRVIIESIDSSFQISQPAQSVGSIAGGKSSDKMIRCAVLISGTGTNLQALIDSCSQPDSTALLSIVISNKAGVQGLDRARASGIPTKVISHKDYSSREEFDSQITAVLEQENVELICLAGFMRILSGKFVQRWRNRILNVHPSLLPSFRGMNAHEQVLQAGVKITGCTVHMVEEEIDSGEILEQEAVPVLEGDSLESLQERVKKAEHAAFPRALQNLTRKLLI